MLDVGDVLWWAGFVVGWVVRWMAKAPLVVGLEQAGCYGNR